MSLRQAKSTTAGQGDGKDGVKRHRYHHPAVIRLGFNIIFSYTAPLCNGLNPYVTRHQNALILVQPFTNSIPSHFSTGIMVYLCTLQDICKHDESQRASDVHEKRKVFSNGRVRMGRISDFSSLRLSCGCHLSRSGIICFRTSML